MVSIKGEKTLKKNREEIASTRVKSIKGCKKKARQSNVRKKGL